MTIDLKTFQARAARQVVDRYVAFANHDERPGTRKRLNPYFQALSSITGSGKTPMLAQAVAELRLAMLGNCEPVVLWMSKARSVVAQTNLNFSSGGKYASLIDGFRVVSPKELDGKLISDASAPLLITLTTGLFNQEAKGDGTLNFHQPNEDRFGGKSPWDVLKERKTGEFRRPLIVVYDEAHNLSEQQTGLLEQLEPEAYLMASATLIYPRSFIEDVIKPFNRWAEKHLKEIVFSTEAPFETTIVCSKAVVGDGLIKKHIQFDGTTASMESCLSALLSQYRHLEREAKSIGITPKAIYVCDTNIVKGEEMDDPGVAFEFRKSPMIRVWRHLVEAGVDPKTIAIYTSQLDIDPSSKPVDFNLFGKKEADFYTFHAGNFRHIIFNQSLQEGWDDPECYLGYIDKSMESRIQIEQIIGRVLRQPKAKHYENPDLNAAQFFIRVDRKETFSSVVESVQNKLGASLPTDFFRKNYSDRDVETAIPIHPKFTPSLGMVNIDLRNAAEKINALLPPLCQFKEDDRVASGKSEVSIQRLDVETGDLVERAAWEADTTETRRVRLRWLIATRIREISHRVLNITDTADKRFDLPVQFGSQIDRLIMVAAKEAVRLYREHASLDYNHEAEVAFPSIWIRPSKSVNFDNAVFERYSGLNEFELKFARALDALPARHSYKEMIWHRNPSSDGGYAIPLLDDGETANFYPDFIVWHKDLVYCLDTKGRHLLDESVRRKLFDIKEGRTTKLVTRFITKGKQSSIDEKPIKEGYTVWRFKDNREYPVACDTLDEAAEKALEEN